MVEDGVVLGPGSSVWGHAHLRSGAVVGAGSSIGGGTYIAGGVVVGDRVKVNAMAYLCSGVTLEDGVMVAAGVVFTNDRHPRATTPDLTALQTSAVTEETLPTLVREGATVGARAVVGCGLTLGRWSMVGMGAVVTHDVADHVLVAGVPARPLALVSRAGASLVRLDAGDPAPSGRFSCDRTGEIYDVQDGRVVTVTDGPGTHTWGLS